MGGSSAISNTTTDAKKDTRCQLDGRYLGLRLFFVPRI